MALSYNTLVASKSTDGSIANWINRSDLPVAAILDEAEAWIYERLRVREMERKTTLTFAEGESEAELPADFLDPIGYRPFGYADDLPFVHEQRLDELTETDGTLISGTPTRWTIVGTTAEVDVACSASFAGKLLYYGRPSSLSSSNQTNWLTVRYPSLLRYACLARGYEHRKDTQQVQLYEAMAMTKIGEAAATNDLWRRAQSLS